MTARRGASVIETDARWLRGEATLDDVAEARRAARLRQKGKTMTTCSACGSEYVAGERCPARGDEAHKRPRGRPAYADDERRSVRLEVRLSADEAALLHVWAARLGKSTAEAVRDAATAAANSVADNLAVRRVTARAPSRKKEEGHMSQPATKTTPAKITWAPTEIPAAFSVALRTVRRDIASGALPSVKFGTRRLVRRADLARWLGIPEADLINVR